MKIFGIVLLSVLIALGLAMIYGVSPLRPVREVFTFTTIHASKQQVWQVLTDFSAYRQWNPFYTEIEGKCVTGAHIHVRVHIEEHTLAYATKIQTVAPQSELVWNEQLKVPGLFYGEHRFVLEGSGGQTRLVQQDRYSGALVPLLMQLYRGQTEFELRRMNDALKKRAEQEHLVNAQL